MTKEMNLPESSVAAPKLVKISPKKKKPRRNLTMKNENFEDFAIPLDEIDEQELEIGDIHIQNSYYESPSKEPS